MALATAWDWESEGKRVADFANGLREAYGELTVDDLSDPTRVFGLSVPSLDRNKSYFRKVSFPYVGRRCFRDLVVFLENLMGGSAGSGNAGEGSEENAESEEEFLGMSEREWKRLKSVKDREDSSGEEGFIIGAPGEGKTTCMAAAAGLLRAKYRIVYLSAKQLVARFDGCFRRAVRLAFCEWGEIDSLGTAKDPVRWLESQPKSLVLVDDYNELDEDRTKGLTGTASQRERARSVLSGLASKHAVIYCCSCSSHVRRSLTRSSPPPYLVMAGGYDEAELATFCQAVASKGKAVLDESAFETTGRNPRLLRLFLQGKLKEELASLQSCLKRYISELSPTDYAEFLSELAGGFARQLPGAMDSRCFFVRPNKCELEALSDHLLSAALSMCVTRDHMCSSEEQYEHISSFVSAMKMDGGRNISRCGWNAEEATILVLATQTVSIRLPGSYFGTKGWINWTFKAELVKHFLGGIGAADVEFGARSVVHAPINFNCKAVDVQIEGEVRGKKVICAGQISVDKDPQGSHEGAVEHFRQVIKEKKYAYDLNLFMWVGHFPGSSCEVFESVVDSIRILEITVTFRALHSLLTGIDSVCELIRGQQRNRRPCRAKTQSNFTCSLWVTLPAELCHIHSATLAQIETVILRTTN